MKRPFLTALALAGALLYQPCEARPSVARAVSMQAARILPRTHEGLITAVALDGETLWAVGSHGHLFQRRDGRLEQQAFPARQFLSSIDIFDGQQWVVGHDALIAHRTGPTARWQIQHFDPELEAPLFSVAFQDAKHGMAVGAFGLALITANGGETWERISPSVEDPHYYMVQPGEDGSWYLTGEFGTVLKLAQDGSVLKVFNAQLESTFFGLEVLGPNELLVYGIQGRLVHVQGDASTVVNSGCARSLFGSTPHGDSVMIFGEEGTIVHYRHDVTVCEQTGERIPLLDGVVLGDQVVLATSQGLRKRALAAQQKGNEG